MHDQAIFFTSKLDNVKRILPKTSIQGLLIPVTYPDQQFEKVLNGVKIYFCMACAYVTKKQ